MHNIGSQADTIAALMLAIDAEILAMMPGKAGHSKQQSKNRQAQADARNIRLDPHSSPDRLHSMHTG